MYVEEVRATKVLLGGGLEFTCNMSKERVAVEAMYAAGLCRCSDKIRAIKHVREVMGGIGLKEAKVFVEQAHEEMNGDVCE